MVVNPPISGVPDHKNKHKQNYTSHLFIKENEKSNENNNQSYKPLSRINHTTHL